MLFFILGIFVGGGAYFLAKHSLDRHRPTAWPLVNQLVIFLFIGGVGIIAAYHLAATLHPDSSPSWRNHGLLSFASFYGVDRVLLGVLTGALVGQWSCYTPTADATLPQISQAVRATTVSILLISGLFYDDVSKILRRISDVDTGVVKLKLTQSNGLSLDLASSEPVDTQLEVNTVSTEAVLGRAERQELFITDMQLLSSNWIYLNEEILTHERKQEPNQPGWHLSSAEVKMNSAQRENIEYVLAYWSHLRSFSNYFVEPLFQCISERSKQRFNPQADLLAIQPLADSLGDFVSVAQNIPGEEDLSTDQFNALKSSLANWIADLDAIHVRFSRSPRQVKSCQEPGYLKIQPIASLDIRAGRPLTSTGIEEALAAEISHFYFVPKLASATPVPPAESKNPLTPVSFDPYGPRVFEGMERIPLKEFFEAARTLPLLNLVLANFHAMVGDKEGAVYWSISALDQLSRRIASNNVTKQNDLVRKVLEFRINQSIDRHLQAFDFLSEKQSRYQDSAVRAYNNLGILQREVSKRAVEGHLDLRSRWFFDVSPTCIEDAPLGESYYIANLIMLNNTLYLAAENQSALNGLEAERAFFSKHVSLPCAAYFWSAWEGSLDPQRSAFLDTLGKLILAEAAKALDDNASGESVACSFLRQAEATFKLSLDVARSIRSPDQIDFSNNGSLVLFPSSHLKFTRDALSHC